MLRMLMVPVLAWAAMQTGFAVHDLTKLPVDPAKVLGTGYEARTEPARLIMMCAECAATPLLDIRIGRQDDGTEARMRAGTTTVPQLEAICRQRDPNCRMEALSVAPAIGWMSSYKVGAQSAHTLVIIRDGDLLTIRVLSGDADVSRQIATQMITKFVPTVVGP